MDQQTADGQQKDGLQKEGESALSGCDQGQKVIDHVENGNEGDGPHLVVQVEDFFFLPQIDSDSDSFSHDENTTPN